MNDKISEAIKGIVESYYSKNIKSGMNAEIRLTDEISSRKQSKICYRMSLFPCEIRLYASAMEKLIIELDPGVSSDRRYATRFFTRDDSPFYDFTMDTMRACERGLEEAGYKPSKSRSD